MRRYLSEAAPLCLLTTVFFSWLSVRQGYIGNISDSVFYLTVADYFSPYWTAPYGLGASLFHDFSFPPLYPLILAALGGGSEHPVASYIATSFMMASALAAVYVWLRTEQLSLAESLSITVVYALLPATLLAAMAIQSEPLYVACTFAGFALWSQRGTSTAMRPLAAICIGGSALARTVGVSAIAALLINWYLDEDERVHWYVPVLAIAPYLTWVIVKYVNGMQPSYFDSVVLESARATLVNSVSQFTINVPAMWSATVRSFDLAGSLHATVAVTVCALFFAFGFAVRLRRLRVDALYVAFYLAIIVLWPYPGHMRRFLQVLMPMFLLYGFLGIRYTIIYLAPALRRTVERAYVAILVIVLSPSALVMVQQIAQAEGEDAENFVRSPQWYMYDTPLRATTVMERVMQVIDGMRGIDERLPANACVSSAAYAYIPLYGRRQSRRLAGISTDDDRFFAQLRDCPYVFMMAATQWPEMDYPAMYPYERIKDQLEVVEVSLWDRTATTGTVLTMLGRVRFDGEGGPE
jgi:hypothetical protein